MRQVSTSTDPCIQAAWDGSSLSVSLHAAAVKSTLRALCAVLVHAALLDNLCLQPSKT
jgi:hypothetical protein